MVAFTRNSKPDTRLLVIEDGGGAASLAVDISQWESNLINNTTYLVSTNSALGRVKTIQIVANIEEDDLGYLANFGAADGSTWIYNVEVRGPAGVIRFNFNNDTELAAVEIPNIGAARRTYLIHWTIFYSVLDASYVSEFAICDIATDTWEFFRQKHAAPNSPALGDQFNLSGFGAGTYTFDGGLANIESVRLSDAYHSTTHAQEDWITESSAPTIVGIEPSLELIPLSEGSFEDYTSGDDVSLRLLASGTGFLEPSYAGPAELIGTMSAEANSKRLWSPLLNVKINRSPTLQNTYLPTNFYGQVGGTGERYGIHHLWCRPIPPYYKNVFARVRVFVHTWISAGAPGGTTVDFSVRLVGWRDPPTSNSLPDPNGTNKTALTQCTTNHGSTGVGEWLNLGEMMVPRDKSTFAWFGLGILFGSGTGASYLRAKIKHVVAELYAKE